MSPENAAIIDAARDAAQQIVTARLHGDGDTAGDILLAFDHAQALAATLVDLVLYVHNRWGRALAMSEDAIKESWAHLLADIEEWRTQGERTDG